MKVFPLKAKYLDPDRQLQYYTEEWQLLDKKIILESILRDLEPAVSSAFNDEDTVYYALTYME